MQHRYVIVSALLFSATLQCPTQMQRATVSTMHFGASLLHCILFHIVVQTTMVIGGTTYFNTKEHMANINGVTHHVQIKEHVEGQHGVRLTSVTGPDGIRYATKESLTPGDITYVKSILQDMNSESPLPDTTSPSHHYLEVLQSPDNADEVILETDLDTLMTLLFSDSQETEEDWGSFSGDMNYQHPSLEDLLNNLLREVGFKISVLIPQDTPSQSQDWESGSRQDTTHHPSISDGLDDTFNKFTQHKIEDPLSLANPETHGEPQRLKSFQTQTSNNNEGILTPRMQLPRIEGTDAADMMPSPPFNARLNDFRSYSERYETDASSNKQGPNIPNGAGSGFQPSTATSYDRSDQLSSPGSHMALSTTNSYDRSDQLNYPGSHMTSSTVNSYDGSDQLNYPGSHMASSTANSYDGSDQLNYPGSHMTSSTANSYDGSDQLNYPGSHIASSTANSYDGSDQLNYPGSHLASSTANSYNGSDQLHYPGSHMASSTANTNERSDQLSFPVLHVSSQRTAPATDWSSNAPSNARTERKSSTIRIGNFKVIMKGDGEIKPGVFAALKELSRSVKK